MVHSGPDVDVEDNRDGTYKVYFRVDKPGDYVLNIKFGGETIPDGLYTFTVSTILHRFGVTIQLEISV